MDKNRHLLLMRRLLRDIYNDPVLAEELKFKGGTAAMFFHGLPRFSTDLDFNLTNVSRQQEVYERLKDVAKRYGILHDNANKAFSPMVVLDYSTGERKLKVEVSNRWFDNHYELLELATLSVPVMVRQDMLTHKLCALRERVAPRDVFDVWFFLSKGWALNPNIIMERTGMEATPFLISCIDSIQHISTREMMMEIGEMLDENMKDRVRKGIIGECSGLLSDYASYPLLANPSPTTHTELLLRNREILPFLFKEKIDPSTVSTSRLEDILSGKQVILKNKKSNMVSFRLGPDGMIRKSNKLGI